MSSRFVTYDAFESAPRFRGLFDALLSRRVVAFVIDVLVVSVITAPVALVIFILGLLTFGLGWALMAPAWVIIALLYVALCAAGTRSATVGMRIVGIELRTTEGPPVHPLLAVAHALLFWASVTFLTPVILLVGLVSDRRRLLHDIVLGVLVVNSAALD
jgi:uncharacterized RDD family membrane protein YckC